MGGPLPAFSKIIIGNLVQPPPNREYDDNVLFRIVKLDALGDPEDGVEEAQHA